MRLRFEPTTASALKSHGGDLPDQGSFQPAGGVSTDTLRRWADDGWIKTITDDSGRLAIDGAVLAKFAQELAERPGDVADQPVVAHSARNRLSGLIIRVVRDTVMAQVVAGDRRFRQCHRAQHVDDAMSAITRG